MNEKLEIKSDERGNLIEIFKIPEVGQIFYSTSRPGIVRGNHYHTRKREWFCVVDGEGFIRMRNRDTQEIREFKVSGKRPEVIEMLVNWTHSIQNIGSGEMKLIVRSSEVFNPKDPDTFAEAV